MTELVVLDQVSKTYREGDTERVVFSDVTASFHRGEFVAVQGRSGSGKSTLLNLVGGLDLPSRGRIRVADHAISEFDEQRRTLFRRRHVGFVFQFFNLIPTLTVGENLRFGLELNGFDAAAANRRVRELLEPLGLSDRVDSFPDALSGGEQQRVAIARAIAHRPTVVLADEPTGNLDVDTEREVLAMLAEIPRQHQALVIAATHSAEVARCADRVLALRDGRLRTV